jgi:hypothetical protein
LSTITVVVGARTVVAVTGKVVVGDAVVVELAGTLVVVVALLLVELWVASAVIPTAASATMATMATTIQPVSSGDFFSASLRSSGVMTHRL